MFKKSGILTFSDLCLIFVKGAQFLVFVAQRIFCNVLRSMENWLLYWVSKRRVYLGTYTEWQNDTLVLILGVQSIYKCFLSCHYDSTQNRSFSIKLQPR